jgi:leucyl aminopeptidase
MPLSIALATDKLPEKGSLIITATDGGKLGPLGKQLDKKTGGAISKAMKIKKFKGKPASMFALLAPAKSDLDRIVVLGVGDGKKLSASDAEKMGGTALGAVEKAEGNVVFLLEPMGSNVADGEIAARAAIGAFLRDYKFENYKTKNKSTGGPKKFTVATKALAAAKKAHAELKAVADGTIVARNLVNEPSNILTPPEFAKRAKALSKLGVKVEVLSEAQMKKLGMGSLLGVGQGSVQPSQMVVMQWQGAAKSKQPIAFVGKGVCFDTGGISIKPAGGMEDMKGDMGGAAAVTGLMHALASRKAKVNAVGILGLVENMPDGNAQRPGDIVTSMSGQTIEVLNTDAEGRLVLADALWYTQKLTGAIMIALGQDYAGMFASDDKLAQQLAEVGEAEGEKVWRMPMNDNFDKMINTPNADMKNIGGRYAGSSTAAQFLKRFTNDVPWVHLDIAGTAMGSPKSTTSRSWASGYGVRLLDRLVKAHYEK